MSGEVSAVNRRHVRRLEYAQLVQIVPVEEMPVEAPHSLQRSKHFLDAIDHVGARDETEVYRAYRRQKLQPDVSRRCAERENRLRIFLEVVRRQPVRFFGHELLEVHPVQVRVPERSLSFCLGQMHFAENHRTAQSESDARARQPHQDQRQGSHDEQEALIRAGSYADRDV